MQGREKSCDNYALISYLRIISFRFMCRLNEQLKYFVTMKISTDSLWQNVTVILSGHETPGEGEHKIMDFIRHGEFDSPSLA